MSQKYTEREEDNGKDKHSQVKIMYANNGIQNKKQTIKVHEL